MFNKKLIMAICALIISITAVGHSHAWQFTMEAAFSNSYEYYGQLGKNGFFGQYDVDRSGAALNYAALNGWVGDQVGNLVAGSDASRQYFNLDFFPEIRLNPAIRIRAQYRLGDYDDPDASDYLANTRPGTDVATSDGQWTMWWLSAQTPWGILVMGKRPMWFGCGLQYGDGNPTTEGVAVVSSYGPMRIGFGFRPYWQQGNGSPYYNIYDKNGIRRFVAGTFLTYRAGPVDMGARISHPKWHAGPESQLDLAAGGDQKTFRPMDVSIYHGSGYVKYNNGRFFFNSELAHWNHTITRQRASDRLGLAMMAPRYFESWRFMTELGAFVGPAKISLFYSYMPGHDRRDGVRIHKQPIRQAAPQGTHEMHRPYSYLLGYGYGAGINAFDHNGNGYINAAAVYAGRIDYSLAANLNFFGSFLWADRTSHGYGWGFIKPNITLPDYELNYASVANAPSIPDMNLGWEAQMGADWDLLEGLNFHALFSYWQPGKWFNYACIDRGVVGWNNPTQNNSWGINPDRQIDPIIGAEIAFSSEF